MLGTNPTYAHSPEFRRGFTFYMTGVGLCFAAFIIFYLFWYMSDKENKKYSAPEWQQIDANIHYSQIKEHKYFPQYVRLRDMHLLKEGRQITTYPVLYNYSYKVDGKEYKGTGSTKNFILKAEAEAVSSTDLDRGEIIPVYYQVNNPKESKSDYDSKKIGTLNYVCFAASVAMFIFGLMISRKGYGILKTIEKNYKEQHVSI